MTILGEGKMSKGGQLYDDGWRLSGRHAIMHKEVKI